MMKRLVVASLILISILAVRVFATPIDTVTMTYTGFGAGDTMKVWGGGWTDLNVYMGIVMFNKTAGSGTGQLLENGSIGGFCMDLSEYAAGGSKTYDVLKPEQGLGGGIGTQKAAFLAELWGRYFDPAWAAGGTYASQQNSEAEAFASAVWEIIYEDLPASSVGWDVTVNGTGGNRGFRAENLDYALANSWLGSLNGTGPMANLKALSYDGIQDVLVEIPEPATAAFIVTGLLFAISRGYKSLCV